MKAIICTKYGSPDVLQLRDVAKPFPKDSDILIKIYATTITASDCIIRGHKIPLQMSIPFGLAIGFNKPRQSILGMVLAGEVEAVGKSVSRFHLGDQVFAFNPFRYGAYAEYICLPETSVLALKPSNVTYEEAAAIPFGGLLALHYLRKGKIQSRQQVLIYGASGAVGTAAVQLATYFGATVTGVCSTANVALVHSLGAGQVLDYTRDERTSNGAQYDLIVDTVGKAKSSLLKVQCRTALAPNGIYLSIDDGQPTVRTEGLLFLKEIIEAGKFKSVIDRCYPLEQIAEAHRYVETGHKKGNVVITVAQNNHP